MLENIALAVLAIPVLAVILYPIASAAAVAVPVEKVNTGSSSLNHSIENFYKCISDTHKDPPSISKVNDCYFSNVGTETGFQPEFVPSFSFHHFDEQQPSIIVHSFHHFFHHHHSVIIEGFNH